jgi:hypothetical protein
MGQARLRGTTEERCNAAEAAVLAERNRKAAERRLREQEQERIRAAKWAAMTQPERDAALKRAEMEAECYGVLSGTFGGDIAGLIMDMDRRRKRA